MANASSNVRVTNWDACFNSGDMNLVVTCSVTAADGATITGVGIILNTHSGETLATGYTELGNGVSSASPSLNLPAGTLQVGDAVMGVVTGEAGGHHFLFEQDLVVGTC